MSSLKFILFILILTGTAVVNAQFECGAEVFISGNGEILKGKRIGLVTNHTAILSDKTHLLDALVKAGYKVTALFGPEHGVRGNHSAGAKVSDAVDEKTGIPAYSLYGKNRKPTPEMLKDVDILVYDIQDVGARFYTYISTLYYICEVSAEQNLPLVIFDRPNPLGGEIIAGPILNPKFKSFVGIAEIPIQYGLTPGEIAGLFSATIQDSLKKKPAITVIKMKRWGRDKTFNNLNFPFVAPSPNLNSINAVNVYTGTCLIEGTNLSEGRGTSDPFLTIGAPFIDEQVLSVKLNSLAIKGVKFAPVSFTPRSIPGVSDSPKLQDKLCKGIKIQITGSVNDPVLLGVTIIAEIYKLYPKEFEFKSQTFDKLCGTTDIREAIVAGKNPVEIAKSWDNSLTQFKKKISQYLLY